MKKCNACAEEKDQSEFYVDNRSKTPYCHCKVCHQKSIIEWKKKYPEKYQEQLDKRLVKYRNKRGIPLDKPRMPKKCPEGTIGKNGYRVLRDKKNLGHPCCSDKKGRIFAHVLAMYNHLGRPLRKGETIHHKNGIRDDNRIENLELWDRRHPPGQRVVDRIKYYKEYLEFHGYEVVKKEDVKSNF